MKMDKDYLLFYILGIVFSIALVFYREIEPINFILIICVATTINVNAIFHFNKPKLLNTKE